MHLLRFLLTLTLPLSTLATNHNITVGPNLTFTPNSTTAAKGDTLTFHFYPGKHNVAQSTFSTPCDYTPNGFYSGFIAPEAGEDNTTFVVTVNNTDPIWYYCSEAMHCQLGMVGVVNPPHSSETLEIYALAAAKTNQSATPAAVAGGVFSVLGSSASSTASGSSTATSSASPTHSVSAGVVIGRNEGNVLLNGFGALVAVAAVWAGLI